MLLTKEECQEAVDCFVRIMSRAGVVLLISCTAIGGAGSVTAQTTAAREHVITMANMNFGKMPSDVKVGDTIVWINRDTVQHTATARDKSFDYRLAPGQRARMTVQKAGTVPVYCIYHAAMRATLTVAAR